MKLELDKLKFLLKGLKLNILEVANITMLLLSLMKLLYKITEADF